jgi:hypothetical protein
MDILIISMGHYQSKFHEVIDLQRIFKADKALVGAWTHRKLNIFITHRAKQGKIHGHLTGNTKAAIT